MKHIFALTNAIIVLGLVLITIAALIFSIAVPMLLLGVRGAEALILYPPIPFLMGLYFVRRGGKLASAIIHKNAEWTVDSEEVEEEMSANRSARTRIEAIALTVIGLSLIVGAMSSVVTWLYDELFDDSMRRYVRDSIFSRSSMEWKNLLPAIVQLTMGIFFLTGQRVILRWLKKHHKAEEDLYVAEKAA